MCLNQRFNKMPASSCLYAGCKDSAEKYNYGGLWDGGDAFACVYKVLCRHYDTSDECGVIPILLVKESWTQT